jgi:hypothetical protein
VKLANVQIEECKLRRATAVFVNESRGEIAAENGPEVVVWDLRVLSAMF